MSGGGKRGDGSGSGDDRGGGSVKVVKMLVARLW